MNHHLRILDFALAGLLRGWLKTTVIVAVYALVVGLVASMFLYVGALRREADALLEGSPELIVQRLTAGRHDLVPVARAREIVQIRGVISVRPRVWGYTYDPPSGATLTLWGAESVPREALDLDQAEAGELVGRDGCVVGRGLAEARFLGVGDRLPLLGADGRILAPRVRGVFSARSSLLTNDLVVLPSDRLRELFAMGPGVATDLAVEVGNPREVETVARKIQLRWSDLRTISRRQILGTYDAVFDWRGGVWAALLVSSIVAFGILVWDKATGLSAEEYRVLGVLKAVGWRSRDVLELRLWEGLATSAAAVLIGLIAAQVHLRWFGGALFGRVLAGWSSLFPEIDLRPEVDLRTLLLLVPCAVLPYVAASLIPSWRAAVTDPDTIIRS